MARGLPLDKINKNNLEKIIKLSKKKVLINHTLCNGNPDVDAIFRLMNKSKNNIKFIPNKKYFISKKSICPFNSQSTVWFKDAFPLMYLPTYCSIRSTDIWRGLIAEIILKNDNQNILFSSPIVFQNRNKMFSSIIQAVALSVANTKNCPVEIAMGIHAGDHAIYPDCRQEFRDADYKAFKEGNWEADKVTYYTPYLNGDKFDILMDGQYCCEQLDIDFDEVYKRTNTSYKPDSKGRSDYKSASSVERIEAFIKLGRKDPVEYVDGWDIAKTHVTKLLAKHV